MEDIENKEKAVDQSVDSTHSEDEQDCELSSQPRDEMEAIRRELDAKSEEAKALQDKYLRLAAEFENYKRRAQRDQSDVARFANDKLLKDLLPTIDNLERAIQCGHDTPNSGGLMQGVELTYKQFLDTLTKLGVSQITSIGEPFDPSKHQAVAQVESPTAPENTVVEEFQKGYFLHERILRPAMVTVASANANPGTATHEEEGPGEGGEQR